MNGMKSGKGTLEYYSGARYEGLWENDRANRKGIMKYANKVHKQQHIIYSQNNMKLI